jgi:hypothetical protein
MHLVRYGDFFYKKIKFILIRIESGCGARPNSIEFGYLSLTVKPHLIGLWSGRNARSKNIESDGRAGPNNLGFGGEPNPIALGLVT